MIESSPATSSATACRWRSSTPPPALCAVVWTTGLLVIFSAGAVSGAAAYAYWHHEHMLWLREHPEEVPGKVVANLTYELGLTDEQIPLVAEAVRRNHAKLEALQDEIRPRVDKCCAQMEDEMAALLTKEQFAKWLPHFREVRKFWLP